MNLESERQLAEQRLNVFRSRYRAFGENYFPIQMAKGWKEALQSDPPDLLALTEIMRRATARRNEFDISFFTFCNDMEGFIRDHWGSSLGNSQ